MRSIGKALKMTEIARLLAKNKTWEAASADAKHSMPWFREIVGATEKAAVSGSSLADLQGNLDYQGAVESFLESLRSKSVFDRLAAEGAVQLPLKTRILTAAGVPIVGTSSASLSQSSTRKTKARPVSKISLTAETLTPETIAAMAVFSNEALLWSGANSLIERELSAGVGAATDQAFLTWLTDEIGSNVLAADSTSDPLADLSRLLAEVCITGNEKPFLIVSPTASNYLATAQSTDGLQLYPEMSPTGGILGGVQVLVSDQQETESDGYHLTLIDASGLAYGDEGLEIKSTSAGILDMSDPADPDSLDNLISLFQEDCTAIGCFRHLAWKLIRSNAAALMTGVNWDGGSTT